MGTLARFFSPSSVVAVESAPTLTLLVADKRNNGIRRIVLATRNVTTVTRGSSFPGYSDGVGTNAQTYMPTSLASDLRGNVYLIDLTLRVRRIETATMTFTTLAGTRAASLGYGLSIKDGVGTNAEFLAPSSMTIDPAGATLWIVDSGRIRRFVISTLRVTTLTGTFVSPNNRYADGGAAVALMPTVGQIYADDGGNLIFPDSSNCRVRKVVIATAFTSTIAGRNCGNDKSSADGRGTNAIFGGPSVVVGDGSSSFYVIDGYGSASILAVGAGFENTVASRTGSRSPTPSQTPTPPYASSWRQSAPGTIKQYSTWVSDNSGGCISADGLRLAVPAQYVAASGATVWGLVQSSDAGVSWTPNALFGVDATPRSLRCSSDGSTLLYQRPANGTWLSRDFGATWTFPSAGFVRGSDARWPTAVTPDGATLYFFDDALKLVRSLDGGATWTAPLTSVPAGGPGSTGTAVSTVTNNMAVSSNGTIVWLLSGSYHNVLVSKDAGATFTSVPFFASSNINGNQHFSETGFEAYFTMSNMAFRGIATSADARVVYVAGRVGKLWRSINGGDKFWLIGKDVLEPTGCGAANRCVTYFSFVGVSADATKVVLWYDSPGTIAISTDSGATWYNKPNAGNDNVRFATLTLDGTQVLAGANFRSSDSTAGGLFTAGHPFPTPSRTPSTSYSPTISVTPSPTPSAPYGKQPWSRLGVGVFLSGPGYAQCMSPDGMRFTVTGQKAGAGADVKFYLWQSSDGGLTWSAPNAYIANRTDRPGGGTTTWLGCSDDQATMFWNLGTFTIVTRDAGATWTEIAIFTGTSQNGGGSKVAVSADGGIMFRSLAINNGLTLYRSGDGGATWAIVATWPGSGGTPGVLDISADGQKVIICLIADATLCYRSTDSFATFAQDAWIRARCSTNYCAPYTGGAMSRDGQKILLIGMNDAIRTLDGGASWTIVGNGYYCEPPQPGGRAQARGDLR